MARVDHSSPGSPRDPGANDSDDWSVAERLVRPVKAFAEHKLAGAGLLVAATLIALFWANSPVGDAYREVLATDFTAGMGDLAISKPLLLWINDGLMGVFFFLVGLEIKRELLVGELSSLRDALLPIIAAVGGMLVPAAVYLAFNADMPYSHGWAIPMATDIAFCLGVLALLGDRIPTSLKVFLTALAIVDDIGAIFVIGVFYSDTIGLISLGLGAAVLAVSIASNRLGVRNPVYYFALGTLAWLAFLESGIHATLAAVLMAFTIPARTRIVPSEFVRRLEEMLIAIQEGTDETGAGADHCNHFLKPPSRHHVSPFLSEAQHRVLAQLEDLIEKVMPPVQRLQYALAPVVTFLVLPVFALANAGVALDASVISDLSDPVALGIMLGLFVGKPVGVLGFSWLAVRTKAARLPSDLTFRHVYGAATLAGIGFTMSLFIGELAFADSHLRELTKASILTASVAAGLVGWLQLRYWAPGAWRERTAGIEATDDEPTVAAKPLDAPAAVHGDGPERDAPAPPPESLTDSHPGRRPVP